MISTLRTIGSLTLLAALALSGCAKSEEDTADEHDHDHELEMEAFSLAFAATDGSAGVDCSTPMTGLGPDGEHTVGLSDLRFYVSNLQLWDANGELLEVMLDENEFQYQGESDWVGLIDLTSDSSGTCSGSAIAYSEGTARTNEAITGMAHVSEVVSISFDVGVSQELMQEIIATNTVEGAPSPMDEMYWSWASGYRHFVFNMTVNDGETDGEGYMHVGSRDCAGDGELALENQDTCGFIYTPAVELECFDLASNTVTVDLAALLDGVDFITPIYDPKTMEVIGETAGAACHSSPTEPHCAPAFENLGIDQDSGSSSASANAVFGMN